MKALGSVVLVLVGGLGLQSSALGAQAAAGAGAQTQTKVVTTAQVNAVPEIENALAEGGLAAARAMMEDIASHPERYAVAERDLNMLGYRCLGRRAFPEAIAVFELNVKRFPESKNAYDSLAEASAMAGDEARLEATLAAWSGKWPGDAGVEARVAELRARSARALAERKNGYRPGQPTGVTGPYFGQPPPGTTPELFAPGIVSLAFTVESFATMSPDGTEFFFQASGRTPGAQVAPPAGLARFPADPPAIVVSRLGPDGWTFPEPAAFTAGYAAREPHVSLDNRRLYWEWFRAVPPGEADPQNIGTGIWASERTTSGWSEPKFVGQAMVVSTSKAGEVFVTDVSELTKGAAYIAKVRMKDGKFGPFERLQGGPERLRSEKVRNLAHPVVAPDGSYLLFDTGGPPARLCFRNADGTWGEPIDLSQHGLKGMSAWSVSPDGKYLFLGKGGDIYWVSTEIIEALRPASAARR